MIKNLETGLFHANNLGDVHNRIRRYVDKYDWRSVYIQHLIDREYDAAHELRCLNDPDYEEECREEAEKLFPVESAPLLSCSEVQSIRDEEELEAVNG